MTYAGLTTADKGALLDAKARGAEWVARDENGAMYGYVKKPVKLNRNHHWVNTGGNDWWLLANDSLLFIQWSDAEPVNISLALAQIAEMESAEKNPIGCEYCSGIETVIRESAYGKFYLLKDAIGGWCVKVNHTKCPPFGGCALKDMIINHLCKIKFCPMCGRDLNSPYTEGANQ